MKQHCSSDHIIKVERPKKSEIFTIRFLIVCGLVSMFLFLAWFTRPEHIGYAPVFWILTFALLFKLVKMLHEWYHYWSVSVPTAPVQKTQWKVDVLTTACPGEPREMIIRTLKAMVNIRYPHTSYLCDEGNDPLLKQVCDELGVIHVTRTVKVNAKAGNINNALKQATGDICVVLDPDHEPVPEFLDRTLPYFEDESIGFVQCVQGYGNQSESIIARGAAEQTYHFYGPMMMCMNSYGTAQAIGANCTFRRKALDSIGGHAAGLSEDMHTAMQLHAKGWRSVYIPEMLTRGLVPATLSSYYKQQLKWSRGTFELLFRTYPKLFKNFTWRQKIHYFTIPLYFLFGLINLFDILVPALALTFAEVPWEVNISHFAFFFIPLCSLSMLIRLYAQRWLLEDHERGFHLAGGILRTATWWIFLVGFIYSIFNIKVPYIPTPKEDEHQNYWKLSLPNFFVCLICSASVVYGLSIDWTPYSFAMASYALINILMLGFIIVMSQQKLLKELRAKIKTIPAVNVVVSFTENIAVGAEQAIYRMFRVGPVALVVGTSLVFLSYSSIDNDNIIQPLKPKDLGGFYKGINIDCTPEDVKLFSEKLENEVEVVAFMQPWDTIHEIVPSEFFIETKKNNALPFVRWSPLLGEKDLQSLISGRFDNYLRKLAGFYRAYSDPVFITFYPAADAEVKPETFIKSWQYVYSFFNGLGVSNLTWVWNPSKPGSVSFYPGTKFVDWIGVSCLNYGDNTKDNDWYSFKQLYAPFRNNLGQFEKPVMITEFGAVKGPDQSQWFSEALSFIKDSCEEVRSLVFFTDRKYTPITGDLSGGNFYTSDFRLSDNSSLAIKEQFQEDAFTKDPFLNYDPLGFAALTPVKNSKAVKGEPGQFQLYSNNKPFYIRGVAYNTAHDWRDGNMPLTRKQVEKDFRNIKAMGANTIRRYDHGIYDRNVLNIAEEYDLKVLFGFWFDPKIDYYKDTAQVRKYIGEVEERVKNYKDHSSILAWSLGNETWGLLKHRYAKPYLTKVREHYVKMIELLARRIHQIDPDRAIFTCIEHEEYQLPGEIAAFRDHAPSIDAVGINSYYKEQISKLNHITWQFDSLRPYLITEFGPRGYWDPKYNAIENNALVEESESEKATWYTTQWKDYVVAHKGYNLGGFAYCWHDRMEGSNTWFGLTDFKGRPKPSYYALKELWTGNTSEEFPEFKIAAPQKFIPGEEYVYSAYCTSSQKQNLKYEWYLHKDEYLERIDNVEYLNEGTSVKVEIPEEASDYRLYLYVSEDDKRVTTASVSIRVTGKKQ